MRRKQGNLVKASGYLLNHYIRWGAKEVVAIDANAEAIKICYFEQDGTRENLPV